MSRHHNKHCNNYNLIEFRQLNFLIPNPIQGLDIKIGPNENNGPKPKFRQQMDPSSSPIGEWTQSQVQAQ